MLLADGTKLKFTKTPGGITIQVPTQAPDKIATVVRLELKEKLPAIQLISNTAKAFEIADDEYEGTKYMVFRMYIPFHDINVWKRIQALV